MERRSLGLRTAAFRNYLAAQFLGAFNDNAYKFLLLGLITGWAAGDVAREHEMQTLAQALFALPFVLVALWIGRDELRRVPLGRPHALHRLGRAADAHLADVRWAGRDTRELARAIDAWDVPAIDAQLMPSREAP